jgi:hypothetical protein
MTKRHTSIVHSPSSISHRSGERGVALILTLAIIALVTLLLIAFVTSMRVENAASKNFNDLIKARELARGAVDQAVAQIRQGTALRSGGATPGYYVTSPGLIYTNGNGVFGPVYLYSGGANVAPTDPINSTNLNGGFWITGQNPPSGDFISEPDSQINVAWVYVPQDPSAPPGLLNPIIGRYAYWVDDEASKININTAGQPGANPNPLDPLGLGYSTNSQVDLNMLLPGLNNFVTAIQNRQVTPNPGFTTIEEVKIAEGANVVPSDFNTNQFYLTTYSDDGYYPKYDTDNLSDLDVFERQRLLPSALVSPGDIDGSAGRNSANFRLTDTALKTVYGSGGTFKDKYTQTGVEQLIANIIAYQHDPQNPADANPFPYDPAPAQDPPPYLGLARVPYVNEVQISYTAGASAPPGPIPITRTVTVELFYLYGADSAAGYVSPGETLVVKNLPAIQGVTMPSQVTVFVPPGTTFGTRANAYHALAPVSNSSTAPSTPGLPITVSATPPAAPVVVDYYDRSGTHRLNCAVVPLASTIITTPATPVLQGAEVIDPCLNANATDWIPYPNGTTPIGTLGRQNNAYAPPDPGNVDSKAHIRGTAMLSVGELGYIHLPGAANVWKHLTLQPGGGATAGQIPDWALLDLFTVGSPTAGRININGFVSPGFPGTTVRRTVPLKALLSSLSSVIANSGAVANEIYDNTAPVARGADSYGIHGAGGIREGVFDTIGELCEVGALTAGANTQAGKEAAIRALANIITVRSGAFKIWVLAQSIKQPPGSTFGTFTPGKDIITGEVKAQAVVERYENPVGNPPQYRTRYFRYLYN